LRSLHRSLSHVNTPAAPKRPHWRSNLGSAQLKPRRSIYFYWCLFVVAQLTRGPSVKHVEIGLPFRHLLAILAPFVGYPHHDEYETDQQDRWYQPSFCMGPGVHVSSHIGSRIGPG
jgi:hypothetical protein